MNFENVLAYVRHDHKPGSMVYGLLFPECEIQITKADAQHGTVTTTIKGARAGDTVRSRISAFIDMARRDKAAVLIAADDASQTGLMRKVILQAMPEMQPTDAAAFVSSNFAGTGAVRHSIERIEEIAA
ncbi:hypothetical protein [Agrobacterium deltaense]|uniref:hypothetical protein n=1 Tax=Agrobacterium deltaense TaxID=1183412 RepID=UPI001C6EEE6A|nr:hypothetical protein [Agrobacterium deltaense]MBW9074949.1 hypothetical protein [Agrobacterium deltaense]